MAVPTQPLAAAAGAWRLQVLARHLPNRLSEHHGIAERCKSRAVLAAVTVSDTPTDVAPPRYTTVPRVPVGSTAARNFLEAEGFCVCSAALSTVECAEVLDGMWRWLESLGTGIDRQNPATWGGGLNV